MDQILNFFKEHDRLAQHLGIELLEVHPGKAKAQMLIRPHHLNGVRTVHGGAIFTLADFAFAVACNSHGNIAVAVHVDISFLKAATQGVLTAQAKEISAEKSLGQYEVRITDDQNNLVALFQGLAYRKRESLLETFGL
jgi:acyl-CoA thioesterase